MKEFFLNEKPVMALVTIRQKRQDVYGSIISKEIDTTYAHTVKIVSRLEENGLIRTEKDGRKILNLTEEGKEYSDHFIQLLNSFEDNRNLNRQAETDFKSSLA